MWKHGIYCSLISLQKPQRCASLSFTFIFTFMLKLLIVFVLKRLKLTIALAIKEEISKVVKLVSDAII